MYLKDKPQKTEQLQNLSKQELINIVLQLKKPIPAPRTKKIIQPPLELQDKPMIENIIQPPIQFQDKPIPAPRKNVEKKDWKLWRKYYFTTNSISR